MNRRSGTRRRTRTVSAAILLLILFAFAGCLGGKRGVPPPTGREAAPSDNAALPVPEILPVIPLPETETDNVVSVAPAEPQTAAEVPRVAKEPAPEEAAALPEKGGPAPAVKSTEARESGLAAKTPPGEAIPPARKAKPVPPPPPAARQTVSPAAMPAWARKKEELVYRIDFVGITMGYARFRYEGQVTIGGKVAFHLNVRAWTSGLLAYIYPVNETIDYYLDTETLAPLRQEFTRREREKDEVAVFDQETGTVTYRFRQSGEIHNKVDISPQPVYDPVSAAYYFRGRDLGGEERARTVYAGKKVWQISARVLGSERIQTERGDVDTFVIQPVIRREGKTENKGDLRMWLSKDEQYVPVRVYAKFRKIKEWTLVGELMPAQGG